MEGLDNRVKELSDKLKMELGSIRKRAERAAELQEDVKSLKEQADEACRQLAAVAEDLKEATGKFGAIMQALMKAQEATKEMESRITEAVVEASRATEAARDETRKAIKASEGKLIGVILIGLLLLAVGAAWIVTQQ